MHWRKHHVVGLANHADHFSLCWCVLKTMQMSFPSWLFTQWVEIKPSYSNKLNQLTLKAITGNIDFSINWLNPLKHEVSKDSIWNVLLLLLLLWLLDFGCYQNILDYIQNTRQFLILRMRSLKDKMSKGVNISKVLYNFIIIFDNCLDASQYKWGLIENVEL